MVRNILTLAGVGFAGLFLAKFLWVLLLPIFGMVIGLVALVLKVAFIAALIWFGFWLFRRMTDRPAEG